MSYERQNFTDGQKLKAEHLNHMEEGIAKASTLIVPVADVGQTIVVKKVDENGMPIEWEAVYLPTMGAFAFNGNGMVFELAMTWSAYCDSHYNWFGFYCDDEYVYDPAGDPIGNETYGYQEHAQNEIEARERYMSF